MSSVMSTSTSLSRANELSPTRPHLVWSASTTTRRATRIRARLVAGGRPWQDRTAVYLLDQAIPGEDLEIAADGHIRDAEPLGEVTDTCAAIAPDGLQDERLAMSGKH